MNKIRFFDGGMGTMLQAAGLLGPGALPEPLNLTHPEEIAAISSGVCGRRSRVYQHQYLWRQRPEV